MRFFITVLGCEFLLGMFLMALTEHPPPENHNSIEIEWHQSVDWKSWYWTTDDELYCDQYPIHRGQGIGAPVTCSRKL